MKGLLMGSIKELFIQALIVLLPFAIIYWLIKSIKEFVRTPVTNEKMRSRYLKITVITSFLLIAIVVSVVMFRQNLITSYKQLIIIDAI